MHKTLSNDKSCCTPRNSYVTKLPIRFTEILVKEKRLHCRTHINYINCFSQSLLITLFVWPRSELFNIAP